LLETVDIQQTDLDTISYRLLPLVYQNLVGQSAAAPLMSKLKGIYRRTWLENQLCLQQIVPFIAELGKRGITPMVLDDLTSLLRLYDGQGARHIYSVDLLVRHKDLQSLFDFFKEKEIWPKVSNGERFLLVETPLPVWPPFDLPLTVAWRIHPAVRNPEQAEEVWRRATSFRLGDCPVLALDLESHFLRACLRSVEAQPEAAFFALTDVAWMLRDQPGGMDWERVIELAQVNCQVLPMITCFQELSALTELAGAQKMLERLRSLPVSKLERLENRWVHTYLPFPGLFARVVRRFLLYWRSIKIRSPLSLLRYFQYAWGGGRLLALPRLAIRHLWSALAHAGEPD
jgi:hypothetical protein